MKKRSNKLYHSSEVFSRILVLFISGIIFYFWNIFAALVFIINIIITLINKTPNIELMRFTSIWLDELTRVLKYLLFISDEKPFPFADIKVNSNI